MPVWVPLLDLNFDDDLCRHHSVTVLMASRVRVLFFRHFQKPTKTGMYSLLVYTSL